MTLSPSSLTCIELCAGAGGQALGLERAGFAHLCLVDNDAHACKTLRLNRPAWHVVEQDLLHFHATLYRGVDVLAAGLPCPPFSKAGKQRGADDERDLFPQALRLIRESQPRAVMIENVPGFLDRRFDEYRAAFNDALWQLGYVASWRLLNAADFGMTQARNRVVMIALPQDSAALFHWPRPHFGKAPTVGALLYDLMSAEGWPGAESWRNAANSGAPTIVGGSKKHGGPDLGPTRARQAWARLGVDGRSIANTPPAADFEGMPRLTVPMVARLQGFPDEWLFAGRKTAAYRQVGNAFPPPIAEAVGRSLQRYFMALSELQPISLAG